jgi:hypothetical protein
MAKQQTNKDLATTDDAIQTIFKGILVDGETEPEVQANDGDELKKLESPITHFKVIGERGEFWYDSVKYHHDAIDDETAQMLIDKGYTQIKFQ